MLKGLGRRLDAEHWTLRREGREGIGQRRRILRQAVQSLEELNARGHGGHDGLYFLCILSVRRLRSGVAR